MARKTAPAKKAPPLRKPAPPARRAGEAKQARLKQRAAPLTYADMRALALSLDLPGVVEATSWGQPTLKTFGKVWFYWSSKENAPVFKVSMEERDFLIEADPDVFSRRIITAIFRWCSHAPTGSISTGRAPTCCAYGAHRRRKRR